MIKRWVPNRGARWILAIVAFVVVLNIAALVESALRPEPSGRDGSAYATQPRGAAAWAELLTRSGRRVSYLRRRPADARLDPQTTLVLLEANDLDAGDRKALGDFLAAGGRLIAAGAEPESWIPGDRLPRPPRWASSGRRIASPVAPVPETAGVRTVATSGAGGFYDAGAALPVLGSDPALMVVHPVGAGRALLLADSGPLQNRLLDRADNAALALALAGPKSRDVVFVESVHGFGEATGLAALPSRWQFALGGLALAALLWLLAHARRLGPAEDLGAQPAPARREHVEALALSLRRASDPAAALQPVRAQARAQVIRRASLAPDAPDDAVREAALRFGFDDDEVAAITDGDDDTALAAGRALAKGRR